MPRSPAVPAVLLTLGALRLSERALALLGPTGDRAPRMRALGLRCWSSAAGSITPDSLEALAQRGMAEASAAGDARAFGDLRLCRGYGHEAGHAQRGRGRARPGRRHLRGHLAPRPTAR